jgi:hypothetical protein
MSKFQQKLIWIVVGEISIFVKEILLKQLTFDRGSHPLPVIATPQEMGRD